MTLIDKDALVKQFDGNIEYFTADETIEMIGNVPTIDAVEVVRCCDCKYSVVPHIDSEGNVVCLYCQHPNLDEDALSPKVDFVDFCSYGHKKEGL